MTAGSLTLREHPAEIVRLACDRCGRAGQYRKASLIVQFGPDINLPDLRHEIARCDQYQKLGAACRVHYVGLITRRAIQGD